VINGRDRNHRLVAAGHGAKFGTDYFTRTAVAKSNIFVNTPSETKYFYQDLDMTGGRLNGANSYTVTFPKGQLPPVRGFWSLTLYNRHHFFVPNEIKRYSVGTKSRSLKFVADGSLTIHVQTTPPADDQRENWLPPRRVRTFRYMSGPIGPNRLPWMEDGRRRRLKKLPSTRHRQRASILAR
jgi:hypothetical protein